MVFFCVFTLAHHTKIGSGAIVCLLYYVALYKWVYKHRQCRYVMTCVLCAVLRSVHVNE